MHRWRRFGIFLSPFNTFRDKLMVEELNSSREPRRDDHEDDLTTYSGETKTDLVVNFCIAMT